MTQHCPHEERLLDYLYEEMSTEEAEAFRTHLGSCAQCQAALGWMHSVRCAFREIPPPAIEEDTLQRMTAQILQQVRTLPQPESPVQTSDSTGHLSSAELGKLLPFRRRGIQAVLFHPAMGILAVAAMALLLVTVRGWQNEQLIPVASQPLVPPAMSPVPGDQRGLAPAAPPGFGGPKKAEMPEKPHDDVPAAEERWREPSARPVRSKAQPATDKVLLKATKRAWTDAANQEGASSPVGGTSRAQQVPVGKEREAALAEGDGALAIEVSRAFPALAAERERSGRVVRSEESPAMPPLQAQPESVPPPLVLEHSSRPMAQQAPGHDSRRTPLEAPGGNDALRRQPAINQRNDLRATFSPRSAGTAAPGDGPMQLLSQLREHVQRGQCREARGLQAQLELRFPAFTIPQEDRLSVARLCLPRANQQSPLGLEIATEQQQAPAQQVKRRPTTMKPGKAVSDE